MPIVQKQSGDKVFNNLQLGIGESIFVTKKYEGAGQARQMTGATGTSTCYSYTLTTDDGLEASYLATEATNEKLAAWPTGQRFILRKGPTQKSSIDIIPAPAAPGANQVVSIPTQTTPAAKPLDEPRYVPLDEPVMNHTAAMASNKDLVIAFQNSNNAAAALLSGTERGIENFRPLRDRMYLDLLERFYPAEAQREKTINSTTNALSQG